MPERRFAPQPLSSYTPIAEYGVIGNLRSVALVSCHGSIDWCCFPELDSPSVFGALLDHRKGGRFRVAPENIRYSTQRYLAGTNVLVTTFFSELFQLSVHDFMAVQGPLSGIGLARGEPEIYRLLTCESGEAEVEVEWSPRFDYARGVPHMRASASGAIANTHAVRMSLGGLPSNRDAETHCEINEDECGPVLRARFRVQAGMRIPLVTRYDSESMRCELSECLGQLERTIAAWRDWVHHCERPQECFFAGPWHEHVVRSGLVLKLLTHPHTGAIAAAATTSLPEEIGGVRNWDYRYSWIRDSSFTAQALHALGHRAEALDFLTWAQNVLATKGEKSSRLQIMYGLHGETALTEVELPHLEGYRGSRPVRIGNAAANQQQLDVFGELLSAAYEFLHMGGEIDAIMWQLLAHAADRACVEWRKPDYGIWEIRAEPRHFVYSKVMAWVALDRALRLADQHRLRGHTHMWRRERDEIRRTVLAEGYNAEVGAFVQAFGSTALDAANLLIPQVGFLPTNDPRVQSTIDQTLRRLTDNGLVYRYLNDDGVPGVEGSFGLPTFWLADALALAGRNDEARDIFEGVASRANHLGLFPEQFDSKTGDFLGNYPQAFTHIGLINSVLHLAAARP